MSFTKIRITYIVVFTILIVIVVGVATAETTFRASDNTKFKVFEDGVTYIAGDSGGMFEPHTYVNIIHEGVEYDCQPTGYHDNQYLNPVCVEIILRSLP